MKILALASQKGGTGKTSGAVALAAVYAQKQKTLLVDFDPQSSATIVLGQINPTPTIADALAGMSPRQAIIKTGHGQLDLLPASYALANQEADTFNPTALGDLLITLSNDYDMAIIDTPPYLGQLLLMALAAADRLLVPVLPSILTWSGLMRLLDLAVDVRAQYNPNLKVLGVFYNMANKRTNVYKTLDEALRDKIPELLLSTQIPMATKVPESHLVGVPINLYAPRSKPAQAYDNLADEVIKRWQLTI